jgi:hypothetical protein
VARGRAMVRRGRAVVTRGRAVVRRGRAVVTRGRAVVRRSRNLAGARRRGLGWVGVRPTSPRTRAARPTRRDGLVEQRVAPRKPRAERWPHAGSGVEATGLQTHACRLVCARLSRRCAGPRVERAADPTTALPRPTTAPPRVTTALPRPTTALPRVTTALPRLTTALPRATRALPRPTRALPRATRALPRATRALPRRGWRAAFSRVRLLWQSFSPDNPSDLRRRSSCCS